jgi:amidohydrolase
MIKRAHALQGQLTEWRRDFHMHPELGFQEQRTSARVAEILEGLGFAVRRGIGRTGVVADFGMGNPLIAIRADMDALPLQEANQTSYASQTPGVMHACGHDAHTAMALGVAALLVKERFKGRVRLLFQPSEESDDADGLSGAPRMIQDGALEGVTMVLATHVDSSTAVGNIRVQAGPASGGVDSWFATIHGRGGHGAKPHESVDPFFLTALVIQALNAIVSRRIDPFDPAVVSIGALHGGQTENVIPESVEMSGTLRFTDVRVQEQIHTEMRRAFELIRPLGGEAELRFVKGDQPMQNAPAAVELIMQVASELLGKEHVLPMQADLGAEDFSCFTERVPGAMFMLGARIDGDERYGHSPRFDIDERALPIGTAILAQCALHFLKTQHPST